MAMPFFKGPSDNREKPETTLRQARSGGSAGGLRGEKPPELVAPEFTLREDLSTADYLAVEHRDGRIGYLLTTPPTRSEVPTEVPAGVPSTMPDFSRYLAGLPPPIPAVTEYPTVFVSGSRAIPWVSASIADYKLIASEGLLQVTIGTFTEPDRPAKPLAPDKPDELPDPLAMRQPRVKNKETL